MKSYTYAIADLHGRHDLLVKAHDMICDDVDARGWSQGSDITVVYTGDYIDRGPQSAQVIQTLRDAQDRQAICATNRRRYARVLCLKGNHEDIMVQTIYNRVAGAGARFSTDWWYGNGGDRTVISYGLEPLGSFVQSAFAHSDGPEAQKLLADVAWADALPLSYVDKHRIYVHAGIPSPERSLDRQNSYEMIWMIYPRGQNVGWLDKHVVHGHHQHPDPELFQHRTNLDCFAWALGRLHIGVFDDDLPGGPIDILVAEGAEDPRCQPSWRSKSVPKRNGGRVGRVKNREKTLEEREMQE